MIPELRRRLLRPLVRPALTQSLYGDLIHRHSPPAWIGSGPSIKPAVPPKLHERARRDLSFPHTLTPPVRVLWQRILRQRPGDTPGWL